MRCELQVLSLPQTKTPRRGEPGGALNCGGRGVRLSAAHALEAGITIQIEADAA